MVCQNGIFYERAYENALRLANSIYPLFFEQKQARLYPQIVIGYERNKLIKYRVKPLCYGNHLEPTNSTKYKEKYPYTSLLSHPKWNYV